MPESAETSTSPTPLVSPRLVAQIAFAERAHDGKLRHPRYTGLRTVR